MAGEKDEEEEEVHVVPHEDVGRTDNKKEFVFSTSNSSRGRSSASGTTTTHTQLSFSLFLLFLPHFCSSSPSMPS